MYLEVVDPDGNDGNIETRIGRHGPKGHHGNAGLHGKKLGTIVGPSFGPDADGPVLSQAFIYLYQNEDPEYIWQMI